MISSDDAVCIHKQIKHSVAQSFTLSGFAATAKVKKKLSIYFYGGECYSLLAKSKPDINALVF